MLDTNNQSFIPKKVSDDKKISIHRPTNLFFLITLIIFLMTVLASVGVFFYKSYLKNRIEEDSIMLEREKGNFDVASIEVLSDLDKRLKSGRELLDKHLDLTGLFDFLEKNTLNNVRFKSFDFVFGNDGLVLTMDGVAKNYSAIVLQSDVFGDSGLIENPIFSDLDVDKDGNVIFNFTSTVDKSLVSYKNN